MKGSALRSILLLCCALAPACSGQTEGGLRGTIVETRIGAEGGTVRAAGGRVELIIPPGALSEPVQVRIVDLGDTAGPARVIGRTSFQLEPEGTVFALPATLRLWLPAGSVAPGGDPRDVGVGYVHPDGRVELSADSQVEADGARVSGPIEHFSRVAAIYRRGPADDGGVRDPSIYVIAETTVPSCPLKLELRSNGHEVTKTEWSVAEGPGTIEERPDASYFVPLAVTTCTDARVRALVHAERTFELFTVLTVCPDLTASVIPPRAVVQLGGLQELEAHTRPKLVPVSWRLEGGDATAGQLGPSALGGASNALYRAPNALPVATSPIRATFSTVCGRAASAELRLADVAVSPARIESNDVGATSQLSVTIRYNDGTSEDITALPTTTFTSVRPDVAAVAARGLVTIGEVGDTAIEIADTRTLPPLRISVPVSSRTRFVPVVEPSELFSAMPGESLAVGIYLMAERGPGAGQRFAAPLGAPSLTIEAVSGGVVWTTEQPETPPPTQIAALDLVGSRVLVGEETGTATFRVTHDERSASFTVRTVALEALPWACRGVCPESLAPKAATEAVISPDLRHPLDLASVRVLLRAPAGVEPALLARYGIVRTSSRPGRVLVTPSEIQFEVTSGGGYVDPMTGAAGGAFYGRRHSLQGAPQTQRVSLSKVPPPCDCPSQPPVETFVSGVWAVPTREGPLVITARKGGLLRRDLTFTVTARYPVPEVRGLTSALGLHCPHALDVVEWSAPADIEGDRRLLNDGYVGGFRVAASLGVAVAAQADGALGPTTSPRGQIFFTPVQAGARGTLELRAESVERDPFGLPLVVGPAFVRREVFVGSAPACSFADPASAIFVADGPSPSPPLFIDHGPPGIGVCGCSCGGSCAHEYTYGPPITSTIVDAPYGRYTLDASTAHECEARSGCECGVTERYRCLRGSRVRYQYVAAEPLPVATLPGAIAWRTGPFHELLLSSGESLFVYPQTLTQATDRALSAWNTRPGFDGTRDPRNATLVLVSRRSDPARSPLPASRLGYTIQKADDPAQELTIRDVTISGDTARLEVTLPVIAASANGAYMTSPEQGDWIVKTADGRFRGGFAVQPAYFGLAAKELLFPLNHPSQGEYDLEIVNDSWRTLRATFLPSRELILGEAANPLKVQGACLRGLRTGTLPFREGRGPRMAVPYCPERAVYAAKDVFLHINPVDLLAADPVRNVFDPPSQEPESLLTGVAEVHVKGLAAIRPDGLPDLVSKSPRADRILLQDDDDRLLDVRDLTLFAFVGLAPNLEATRFEPERRGNTPLIDRPLPLLDSADVAAHRYVFEESAAIGYHVDRSVEGWATKPNALDRSHLFNGDCVYADNDRDRGDLSRCRDPFAPEESRPRPAPGRLPEGANAFGYELDGVLCDPWLQAVPLPFIGYDCNTLGLWAAARGGVSYGNVPFTAEGFVRDAGGTAGGYAVGGESRIDVQVVAETPGIDFYQLDAAYLPERRVDDMPWQMLSKRRPNVRAGAYAVQQPVVRFSSDDVRASIPDPEKVVTAGVAVTGKNAYLEMTTLPRENDGKPLPWCGRTAQGSPHACFLDGFGGYVFQFVPEDRFEPVQLDAVARKDDKENAARLLKEALKIAVDLGCKLALPIDGAIQTVSWFDVGWAIASAAAKRSLHYPSTSLDDPVRVGQGLAWKVTSGEAKKFVQLARDTSFRNAVQGFTDRNWFSAISRSSVIGAVSGGACSTLIDFAVLKQMRFNDRSSAQASAVEILGLHLGPHTGTERARALVVTRSFSTGELVNERTQDIRRLVLAEDAGPLALAVTSEADVDGLRGTFEGARPGTVPFDEPASRLPRISLQMGENPETGTPPTKLYFTYSAVAVAGRNNEAGTARAALQRRGRFLLVPIPIGASP